MREMRQLPFPNLCSLDTLHGPLAKDGGRGLAHLGMSNGAPATATAVAPKAAVADNTEEAAAAEE